MRKMVLLLVLVNGLLARSQDTLYLKNNISNQHKHVRDLEADSLFTQVNERIVSLDFLEDSVIVDFNNDLYVNVKKFYIVLNKKEITDSCAYYFWVKNGGEYLPFFVLGSQIKDATSGINFTLYSCKNPFAFWRKRGYGFVVSLYQGYSSLTEKVKNVGAYSTKYIHVWGRNRCELPLHLVDLDNAH